MDERSRFQQENATGKWYVESDGKVYGPATENTILRSFMQNEIGPLTKIRGPDGTWKPLCEFPKFGEVIQKIQSGEPLPPDVDDGRAHNFAEHTLLSKGILDQLAQVSIRGSQSPDDALKKGPAQGMNPTGVKAAVPPPPAPKAKNPFEIPIRVTLILLVLLVVGGGYWAFATYQEKQRLKEEIRLAEQALEEARRAEREGRYDKALGRVEAAADRRKRDMPLQVERARVLVANNRIKEAAGFLTTAIQAAAGIEFEEQSEEADEFDPFVSCVGKCLVEAKGLLGQVALQQGDYPRAEKLLKESVEIMATYGPSLHNLGVLKILQNDMYAAEAYLLEAVDPKAGTDGEVVLALAHAAGEIFKKKADGALLGKADLVANDFMARTWDLRQEILVARAYLAALAHDKKKTQEFIDAALDVDPQYSATEARDPHYVRPFSTWTALSKWLEVIHNELGEEVSIKLMLALAAHKAGNKLKGLQAVEELLVRMSKNSSVLTVYGFLQEQWGRKAESQAAYQEALKFSPRILTYFLRAQTCSASGDVKCAKEAYEISLKANKTYLPSLLGLADLLIRANQLQAAAPLVKKAMELAPNSLSARKMANDLLEKGVAI